MRIQWDMKMCAGVVAGLVLAASLLWALDARAARDRTDEDIVIVARNFLRIDNMTGSGVVISSKKGRFEPIEFKGTEGTAVLLFMYNRISRNTCVHLVSRLYEREKDEVAPKVDRVLDFLEHNELLLTSKYPNPSRNYGMNKFRPEE